ncbi:unnamed protein product [Citrullus colocynthis]|uniref:Uncharacterized protein n=1 Tax=Citrullus colocynthis TaxID=252529 RepID=A0ABP0YID2_9ROSI
MDEREGEVGPSGSEMVISGGGVGQPENVVEVGPTPYHINALSGSAHVANPLCICFLSTAPRSLKILVGVVKPAHPLSKRSTQVLESKSNKTLEFLAKLINDTL